MSESESSSRPPREERLPPRTLPVLYFAFGHLTLALAFLLLILDPHSLSGFYYHHRTLAVVHLVTLGWISTAILGAIYLVGPIALRMALPARWPDVVAWGCVAVGIVGMASHFWIDGYSGMVWSAGMVTAGILHVAVRALRALPTSPTPAEVRAHVALSFLNVLGAGLLGILIGLKKLGVGWLGGFVLDSVHAHAHLAFLGWAVMMVMGAGYRLLPMFLPAAPPRGVRVVLSAVLLEGGTLGLTVALIAGSGDWAGIGGLVAVAGIAVFLLNVGWMLRHPKPTPKKLVRPDWGMVHALQSLAYLALTCGLGVYLAFTPRTEIHLRVVLLYGTFGLVGFLAQMVIGVAMRLFPMYAWMHAYVGSDFEYVPPAPHEMPDRRFQLSVFILWTVGVPLLAGGLFLAAEGVLVAGAAALLAAVVLDGVNLGRVVRYAYGSPPSP